MLRTIGALLLMGGLGCAPAAGPAAPTTAPAAKAAQTTTGPAGAAQAGAGSAAVSGTPAAAPQSALFPAHTSGWSGVDEATLGRIASLAGDYAQYLNAAKTPRRAVAGLVTLFSAGAAELVAGERPARAPGSRYWFVGPGGQAAAFVTLGREPIEHGAHILIASVDAPRIELKQAPVYDKAGFTMLDTVLHGNVDLVSWLSRPLALFLYIDRPGAKHRGLEITVGEALGDPVVTISDLLPHLSGKAQRHAIVDSPERMDAVAASSHAAWMRFLARQGITEGTLAQAEAALVPAGEAMFIGTDRALLAGYGHSHRALAFAAVRALSQAKPGQKTGVVIVLGDASGATGVGFAKAALARILGALSQSQLDSLGTRRAYGRSAVLLAAALGGEPGNGLVISPQSDDATPAATRRVLDTLAKANVPYQITEERGWGLERPLSTWDLDVVTIGIPGKGYGAPTELISTIDLYRAWLAASAWLSPS